MLAIVTDTTPVRIPSGNAGSGGLASRHAAATAHGHSSSAARRATSRGSDAAHLVGVMAIRTRPGSASARHTGPRSPRARTMPWSWRSRRVSTRWTSASRVRPSAGSNRLAAKEFGGKLLISALAIRIPSHTARRTQALAHPQLPPRGNRTTRRRTPQSPPHGDRPTNLVVLGASITQSPGRSGSDANPADSIEPR